MQTFFQLLLVLGIALTAIGTWGAYYYGRQEAQEDRASLNQQLSGLAAPEEVLQMAAIQRINMAGGIIEPRTHGDGLQVRFLRLDRPFSVIIDYLKDVKNLREISIEFNTICGRPKLDSLDSISNLTELESLELSGQAIEDIRPFAKLSNLRFLSVWENNISDLGALKDLKNLQLLNISDNPVIDVMPLKSLTNLRVLWLEGTKVTSLQPLVTLPELKQLYLGDSFGGGVTPISIEEVERFRSARPDIEVSFSK